MPKGWSAPYHALLLLAGAVVAHGLELRGMVATQVGARRVYQPRRFAVQRLCERVEDLPHASKICDSEAWPALQAELDQLPVFLLANAKGEPLQHTGATGKPTVIFFADLFRAEAELANANRLYPDLGLELLPVGMGDAFRRVQAGDAMLAPSQNELAAAGLDPDDSAVPLFGCPKLMQPRRSDPQLLAMPLFVSSSDARAAIDAALNVSGVVVPEGMTAQGVGLDVLAITLQTVCELIVSGQETRFEVYATSASLEWLQEYAERVAVRRAGSSVIDGGSEGASDKQAMFETLIDQRQALLKQTAGALPRQAGSTDSRGKVDGIAGGADD